MWEMWWLFHATDFQTLMYPCFMFCRILGIFPYKINALTFEVSKPWYILSTVIICICCAINLFFIHFIITHTSDINMESVINAFENISFYTFNSFIIIITHVLSDSRMRLLQSILEISSKLPPETYQKLSRLIHIKDIIGAISLAVLTYIYLSNLLSGINFIPVVVVVVVIAFIIYVTLIEFQIIMLYINCVFILKACFKKINEDIAYMQNLMVNDIKSCVPGLICRIPRNKFFLIKLKTLKKQHLIVSNAVKMLNIIFSLQLLSTIAMAFFSITFELYFYVVRWQDGISISFDWHFFDATFLIARLFYIARIILLVWVCETNKNQAREIATTIHEVLNRTSDEQIKNELQLFSLQILHQENIFSAKGFTVDAKLLARMIGNITTYMLILIQFLIASHTCDKKFGTNITNNSVL